MKNDHASVRLREEHVKWMRSVGEADETVDQLETIVAVHPSWFLRMMLGIASWAQRGLHRGEEDARLAARETYHD